MKLFRLLLTLMSVFALVVPVAVNAQLSPGCRAATAADHAQMEARGLPKSYQVCPGDTQYAGVGKNFEQWYTQLKGVSPCNRNTCTLSCKTRNTGAMVCSGVSRKWNSIGCHPNNNTAVFPTVSHGFAAHIELLRRYCGYQGRCTIASITRRWATANQGPYASFVSRYSGIPYNRVFNPNDIDTVARIALTMSCFEAGSLPYSVQELKQGLMMAAGGPRVPVPPNVGQLLEESLSGSYSAAQPVAPVQPFFGPQGAGTPAANNTTPLPPPIPPQQSSAHVPLSGAKPVSEQLLNPDGSLAQSGQSSSTPALPAEAAVLVQPKEIQSTEQAVVAWTSVGMRDNSCTIRSESGDVSEQLAQKNEGAELFKPGGSAKTITFRLECMSMRGEREERSAELLVK